MAGTFYGVGVGPGDPELITRKAARILSEVDWIFHPSSRHWRRAWQRSIVSGLGLDANKFRAVTVEMSRDRSGAAAIIGGRPGKSWPSLRQVAPWPGSPKATRCSTARFSTC